MHLRPLTMLLTAAGAGLLAGCTVGPDYQPPTTGSPEAFTRAGDPQNDGFYTAAAPEVEWWQSLGDPTIDRLVEAARTANHDVRIARANVQRARAILGEERLSRLPATSTQAGVSREEASAARLPPGFGRTETFYTASFDALWELDFFGRIERSVEALGAEYEAAEADLRTVFVTVAAEVARTYLELRGAQYRLEVAERNARNQRETFELTQALLEGGRGTDLDLARAEAQLETTLASLAPLESEVARNIHRLSVLMGQEPGALRAELGVPSTLPVLPPTLDIGNPGELLRRRPDVQAAERRLAASTARIGVEVADLFPRVSLSGSVGFLAVDAGDFGESGSRVTAFGPFLSWPAFDLAKVRRRIAAAEAGADAQLAVYEQTVLTTLEEAENALVDYARARTRQARLQIAAVASERAADLARVRFRYGADSFLTVLDAERRLLEAQDQQAQSATAAAVAFVAVYKALGGGWENAELEGDVAVSAGRDAG